MIKNKELEFKTIITKEQYESLLKEFDLENNIFSQTNYYFDTEDTKLLNSHIVLRIRQKGENYKLTKKAEAEAEVGADETHIFISKDKANELLENGFDAKIMDLPYFVRKMAQLTTFRVKTPYLSGTLFFDKSEYYGNVDYEIEFEVDDIIEGEKDFNNFLEKHSIIRRDPIRKSQRAFNNRK